MPNQLDAGWTDEEMLLALDMRHGDDLTALQISKRLGRSRSAVLGFFKRVADDDQPDAPGTAYPDGCLGRRWWAKGRRLPRGVAA